MKLYKNFGDMGIPTTTYSPQQQDFAGKTPIDNLPAMDIPTQIQHQEHERDEMATRAQKAIRTFQRKEEQPQYYQQQQYFQPQQQQILPQVDNCASVREHIKECLKCSKKYGNDINTYISIIVGLLLFIMFLFTKIIDKFT